MTIGDKIKNLREKAGLTQTDVAKILGTATQTIYKYEKGIVINIPLENIKKLAKIFDVEPSYIMGLNSETSEPKEKKPTVTGEHSENVDELFSLCQGLPPKKRQQALDYLRFLASQNQDGQDNQ